MIGQRDSSRFASHFAMSPLNSSRSACNSRIRSSTCSSFAAAIVRVLLHDIGSSNSRRSSISRSVKPSRCAHLMKRKRNYFGAAITPHVTERTLRLREQLATLVVADRLDVHVDFRSELPDRVALLHRLTPYRGTARMVHKVQAAEF